MYFFCSLLYSFYINYILSKTRFGPCKVSYRFLKAVVYFFVVRCSTLSFSTSDYLKHVLGLVKSFIDFLRQWCIFFFHCSTLSLSATDYLKHFLHLVKSFMDFFCHCSTFRQWCIFCLSLLNPFLFNHRLSTTRFAPCKVVCGFFPLLNVYFFYHKLCFTVLRCAPPLYTFTYMLTYRCEALVLAQQTSCASHSTAAQT